jgi:hypothetical protein
MTGALSILALLVVPTTAEAHAFAARYEIPLPLWHYIGGAGAAVGLSFVVMALALRESRAPYAARIALPDGLRRGARLLLQSIGLLAFALLIAAGVLGPQGDWDSNPLPVAVWVIWWVGIAFLCALLGDIWAPLDPWRTVGLWLERYCQPRSWPATLGAWPAVLLFFAFAWTELAWSHNAMPERLALLILAYSLFTWIGMATFGVTAWRANADPFARVFGLFARFAPFAVEQNTLIVRPFGAGLRQDEPVSWARTAFVILMLATVSFDGIAETPFWDSAVGQIMAALYALGIIQAVGYTAAGSLAKTLALIATPLLFAAAYLCVCAIVGRIAGETAGRTARRYVLTLVPIAVAYHLAHYLTYLLVQGQMIWPLLSDPFGLGWNLLGGRGHHLDPDMADARFVWLFAVAAVVTGHVAAVALAHAEALRAYGSRRIALASQGPMLLFMVAYTMLSLWILSQPVVAL